MSSRWLDRVTCALVVVAALAAGGRQLALHAGHPRDRWSNLGHDRNAHYTFALRLATDLRAGDLADFARSLDNGSTVWMPLQGLAAAGLMLAAGPGPLAAVVPPAAGLALTIVFGFLLTRRLVPAYGNLAGLAAALLVAMSPAHRAYATDVMLESLGAGLTALALWAYLVCVQDGSRRGGALLGLALTLLFFQKLNYWLLVVLALAAAEVARRPGWYLALARQAAGDVDWRAWLRAQPRRPLNWAILAVVAASAALAISGATAIHLAGLTIRVKAWYAALPWAFVGVVLRLIGWWRGGGAAWVAERLGPRAAQVALWHALPVAVWLCVPKRLLNFAWYLSTSNVEPDRTADFAAGARFYLKAARLDYHATPALVGAVVVAAGLAALACLRGALNRGATAVLALAVLGFALAAAHPNTKFRMAHTWAPAWWFAAAAGVAAVAAALDRVAWRRAGAAALGGLVLALVGWQWPALAGEGAAQERGLQRTAEGSTRDVTDAYLPALHDARRVLVISNETVKFVARWSWLERYPDRPRGIDVDFREVGCPGPATPEAFAAWLDRTACDAVITVEVLPGGRLDEGALASESNALAVAGMKRQAKFRPVDRVHLPPHGCVVTVWRR